MNRVFDCINKRAKAFILTAGVFAMVAIVPTSGYAGLLGTNATGTLNISPSPVNYFDSSAVPGIAPVNALVVSPLVEYPGNQPALQTNLGVTAHISADIADHEILLTWINSSIIQTAIPGEVFTFGLTPAGGQVISSVVFDLGFAPTTLSFTGNSVTIGYNAFNLGGANSAFAHFTLAFATVPEPSTYLLLGTMAVIALFAVRRKAFIARKQEI